MVVARVWGEGNGELCNGCRVSVLQDEEVLVMDGCTTTCMYLMSLNHSLKNGYNGTLWAMCSLLQ